MPGLRQHTESHATGRKPKMRNTIKKIALTVTAVAAIGGLAACGESAEAGKPANTASAPTQQLNPDEPLTQEQLEQIDPEIREKAYLDTLTEMGVPYSTEAEAVEMGTAVCEVLDLGVTVDEFFLEAVQLPGMTEETASHLGALVGAAVPAFCPEHLDQLPSTGGDSA